MPSPVNPGDILLGKYRIEQVLGQGGMGVVVAAHHVDLGTRYAIKFLLPTVLTHEEAVTRFLREARASAQLKSEHVARVHDVGNMDNGAPYMVMEYLEGQDLKAVIKSGGPLSADLAMTYLAQVCDAIGEAHSLGIVHRDLKPANLFVTRRRNGTPCVKVLDFGISKHLGKEEVDLTSTNATLGSPLYMSPEQISKSKSVDTRTDIWALGVILYELLAGKSPFLGLTALEVVSRILQEEPTPIRQVRPDVPERAEVIIARCLRKRREERFQSVDELLTVLQTGTLTPHAPPLSSSPSLPEMSASVAVQGLTSQAGTGRGTSADPTAVAFGQTQSGPTKSRTNPIVIAIAAGTTIVGLGAGAWTLLSRHSAETAGSTNAIAASSSIAPAVSSAPVVIAAAPETAMLDAGVNDAAAAVMPTAAATSEAPKTKPVATNTSTPTATTTTKKKRTAL